MSDKGYWLYATARKNADAFEQRLVFDSKLIEHLGNTEWVEPVIAKIKQALDASALPEANQTCDFCNYSQKRRELE